MNNYEEKNTGWVSFHRRSLESSVWKNPVIWWVWSWCLLKANHQDNKFPFNKKDIIVKKGQFITGREKACKELKLTSQKYRTAMDYLKNTQRLTTKTTNQFTLVIITNWDKYQNSNQQINQRITNEQPTDNQRITTNNNDNNDNNDNNEKNESLQAEACGNDINSLIKLFEPINPSYKILFKNLSQRKALERMIKEHSFKKVKEMIIVLPEIICQKYAPQISTPITLENKLGQLLIFIKQNKGQQGAIKV